MGNSGIYLQICICRYMVVISVNHLFLTINRLRLIFLFNLSSQTAALSFLASRNKRKQLFTVFIPFLLNRSLRKCFFLWAWKGQIIFNIFILVGTTGLYKITLINIIGHYWQLWLIVGSIEFLVSNTDWNLICFPSFHLSCFIWAYISKL